jgi:aromatic-L-amino-acid decarboxylase
VEREGGSNQERSDGTRAEACTPSVPGSARGRPDLFPELDLDRDSMARLIEAVSARVLEHLESLPAQPMQSTESAAAVAARLDEPLPERPSALESVLDLLFREVIPCSLNTAAPGYLAYIPGGGLYSAAVAEFAAAAVNRYAGVWAAAPGAADLESQALRWLAELLGFPAGTLGVFTTGASLSNLLAIVAARDKRLSSDAGDASRPPLARGTLYYSSEVHHSVPKAARIAGLAAAHARAIPVDASFRIRVDLLERALQEDRARGCRPFLIIASVGTVNTGAVDPIPDLAELARRHQAWLHVDGAYGAVFRMLPECAGALKGLELADSVAVDPHKGLFLPYGLGALLVKDIADLQRAFHGAAAYLPAFQGDGRRLDFCELTPELSRDWRGLRLWLPLKLHGAAAFRETLRQRRAQARAAWERLRAEPDVEMPGPRDAPPELSLFAFRQRRPGLDAAAENRANRELLARINHSRRVILTGTEIAGDFYLRFCVLHLRTHRERFEEALAIVLAALAAGRRAPRIDP